MVGSNINPFDSAATAAGFEHKQQERRRISTSMHPALPPPQREGYVYIRVEGDAKPNVRELATLSVLMALIVILSFLFLLVVVPPLWRYLVYRCWGSIPAVSRRTKERRYETIEAWIISKRVRAHNNKCCGCHNDLTNDGHVRNGSATDTITTTATAATAQNAPSLNKNEVMVVPMDEGHILVDNDNDDEGIDAVNGENLKNMTNKEEDIEGQSHRTIDVSASYDTADTVDLVNSSFDSEQEEDEEEGVKEEKHHFYPYSFYDENDNRECSICMEPFQVNQIVSWSSQSTGRCNHVFHHECIKEWLLRHTDCPCCRTTFLPVDCPYDKNSNRQAQATSGVNNDNRDVEERQNNNNGNSSGSGRRYRKLNKKTLCNLSLKRNKRLSSTYYCIDCGLVDLPNEKSTKDDTEEDGVLRQKVVQKCLLTRSGVEKNDLVKLRGCDRLLEGSDGSSSEGECIAADVTDNEIIGSIDDGDADFENANNNANADNYNNLVANLVVMEEETERTFTSVGTLRDPPERIQGMNEV